MIGTRASRDFSPLLIGEFGVTSSLNARVGQEPAFQSPPHRGIRCDSREHRCRLRRAHYFSPLLIGEFGVTLEACRMYRCRAVHFSPLLIGEFGVTVIYKSGVFVDPNHFSPLLIGEFGVTMKAVNETNRDLVGFQSPPHRGIRCDCGPEGFTLSRDPEFQSPPHRGIRCDQNISQGNGVSIPDFSPLLIGEFGVTSEAFAGLAGSLDFSPLLIGEFGVTPTHCRRASALLTFQSPPQRGIRCDPYTLPAGVGTSYISVPSSSGNSV